MFNMGMLGDFDRDVFQSDLSLVLFVAFIMIVVIVMLNVLIAIVSDSHELWDGSVSKLFNRSRLEFAEVEQVLKSSMVRSRNPHLNRAHLGTRPHNLSDRSRATYLAPFSDYSSLLFTDRSITQRSMYGEAAAIERNRLTSCARHRNLLTQRKTMTRTPGTVAC